MATVHGVSEYSSALLIKSLLMPLSLDPLRAFLFQLSPLPLLPLPSLYPCRHVSTASRSRLASSAFLEDFKKEGKCPAYKAVDGFEIDKYMGIW